MGRRLSHASLFEPRSAPSWLVLLDPWWNVQAPPKRIEAGGDLLDAFLTEMLVYHRAGWKVHEFSSISSMFFVTRGDRRGWKVTIASEEPAWKPRF